MNKRTLLCLGVFLMLCLVGQRPSARRASLSDPAGEQRQAESVALLVSVTDAAGRLVTAITKGKPLVRPVRLEKL